MPLLMSAGSCIYTEHISSDQPTHVFKLEKLAWDKWLQLTTECFVSAPVSIHANSTHLMGEETTEKRNTMTAVSQPIFLEETLPLGRTEERGHIASYPQHPEVTGWWHSRTESMGTEDKEAKPWNG